MKKNFINELKWRGMLHDIMPGTEELLNKEIVKGYIGFDPTADSLGVGNLVQIMTLLHFQKAGHKPIALVGGATGMVGDPSGKSQERNLLNVDTLQHNLDCQKKQLEKFLDFNCGETAAEIVNNYDWFKNFSFLDFIRDVGKHISVNYMMAKDSVQSRLESGMSFTEFSYQLVQGYDFYYLWKNKGVKLQMGGSDQWGNIVTGTELIRRKSALENITGEAFALTTPLIKKADGTKFGKTEGGNVWLDAKRTSPYQFYQFWMNASDEDVKTYMRIFTLKTREEVESLEAEHAKAPHLRILQKELAKEITIRVHSEEDYIKVLEETEKRFSVTAESIQEFTEAMILAMFQSVTPIKIARLELEQGVNIVDFLSVKTNIFPSKGEARKMVQGGGIAINKNKVSDIAYTVDAKLLLDSKYIIVDKGKKNGYLVCVG